MKCAYYHEFVFTKDEFFAYLVQKAQRTEIEAKLMWIWMSGQRERSCLRVIRGDLCVVIRVPIPDDPVEL